jgi:tRNA pseudouridine13 synthase
VINVEPMYAATDLDLLPRAYPDRPRVAARLKAVPEDFEVDEIPAYTPVGEGSHLYLWIEKRDVAGNDLLNRLAAELAIAPQDIGAAGTKDRRAVTRQWLSVPQECEDRLPWVRQLTDIRILNVVRHGNKLRTGHLWGNRFSILLRDADPSCLADLVETARLAGERGFPNFFGTQRFGWSKDTLRIGLARLDPSTAAGGPAGYERRLSHFEKRMTVSAVQSALFNRCLTMRMERGLATTVLPGDVLQKTETGGLFTSSETAVDQARLDAGEVRLTGPVWGHKMKGAHDEADALERAVLDEAGLTPASFKVFAKLAEGTRRPLFIRPDDLRVEPQHDGIRLSFSLPKGCYATVLMREFLLPEAVRGIDEAAPAQEADEKQE